MASPIASGRAGFSLTGELIGQAPGKPWVGKDGVQRTPHNVDLLVGRRVVSVEYADEASARAATEGLEIRSVVTLPVFVKAKGKDWLNVAGLNLRADERA